MWEWTLNGISKKPDVIIFNKFDKDINKLSNKLMNKFIKSMKKK